MKLDFSSDNILNPSFRSGKKIKPARATEWKNPLFRNFFSHAKPDYDYDKTNYAQDVVETLFAIFLIIVFAPALIFVVVGIKLTSKGDILYKQIRVGKDGKLFKIYKFRSMVVNAEASTGHTLSWDGDPRITKFGNFLRKSHLDELPQLINVIKGDMSFVGPRPERPEFTEQYDKEIVNYELRHKVKPGITGLAQIALVYDATAVQKLKYDLMYISYRNSAFLNILVAGYTAKKMLFLKSTAGLTQS
jgi:lipopolysaccharide/colanic/teichoic acid biosynthesis glycosyltransferase